MFEANQSERIGISPMEKVTVTKMGHIVEVQHMEKKNTKAHIRKLDTDRYIHLETGEIHHFEKSETRADNENSLKQTFKRMRYLINNNFRGDPNELFLTLTYAENMKDVKKLYDDLKKFQMRLRYSFKNKSTVDYLTVVEPQERGAWHAHILLRFNDLEKVYIPNNELAELWGHGFTRTKALKDVDNVGAYLSAYLTDLEIDENNWIRAVAEKREVTIRQVDGRDKKFIKGGRLHLYPPGMNLYRASRGVKKPDRNEMRYKDVKKVVGSAKPHYQKKYEIEEKDFSNTITYEQYNLKR